MSGTSHAKHFFALLLSERPQKSSSHFLQNRPSVFYPFAFLLFSLFCLILLMSDNVDSNRGSIFPCVCSGNVFRSRRLMSLRTVGVLEPQVDVASYGGCSGAAG